MRKIIFCALCMMYCTLSSAQPKQWTLRECCDYAVEHNIISSAIAYASAWAT